MGSFAYGFSPLGGIEPFTLSFDIRDIRRRGAIVTQHVLFIVTNAAIIGPHNRKTGFFFAEVAHPFEVLDKAGGAVDFASIAGGGTPYDAYDEKDQAQSLTQKPRRAKRLMANWIAARVTKAARVSARFSYSFARRRLRPNQEKVRSTTHRRGSTTKPFVSSVRLMISSRSPGDRATASLTW